MAEFIESPVNITETLINTVDCDNRKTTTGFIHDKVKKLIYRIVDGKHDFEGTGDSGRSYINSSQCNNSILKEQLKLDNVDISTVWIGKTLYNKNGNRANANEEVDNLFFANLTDGANSIHPVLDFTSNLENMPYENGQYIRIGVGHDETELFSFCMNRPFVGTYDSKKAIWKEQLKTDRNMYGKNAIYSINIGDKKSLKEQSSMLPPYKRQKGGVKRGRDEIIEEPKNIIAVLNDIFKFNDCEYTIDASSLNKTKVLEPLFEKPSQTIFGDAFDPSSILNGQSHGILSPRPIKHAVNFHFCFLRGISIKINIQIVKIGQVELKFSSVSNQMGKPITYPSKPVANISGLAPSVADISLFIRDKIINTNTNKNTSCFFSLLAAASKLIGKIKGQVPRGESARIMFFTKFYTDVLSSVSSVIGGKELTNSEMIVILTSIKTIGDQLRLKDAQILTKIYGEKPVYCVSLDSFLRDSADGECNLLGDINNKKNFELVIHEKIDLDAQLAALKQIYTEMQPLQPPNISGNQILWYTTEIENLKQAEIKNRIDEENRQNNNEKERILAIMKLLDDRTASIESQISTILSLPPNQLMVNSFSSRKTNNTIMINIKETTSLSQDKLVKTYKYLTTQYYGCKLIEKLIGLQNSINNMADWHIIENIVLFCQVNFGNKFDIEYAYVNYNNIIENNYESIETTIVSIITMYTRYKPDGHKQMSNDLKMLKTVDYLYRYVTNWVGTTSIVQNVNLIQLDKSSMVLVGGGDDPDVYKYWKDIIGKYKTVAFRIADNMPNLYVNDNNLPSKFDVNYEFDMDTNDLLITLYKMTLHEDSSGLDNFEELYTVLSGMSELESFTNLLKQILQISPAEDMYAIEQDILFSMDVNNKIVTGVTYSHPLQYMSNSAVENNKDEDISIPDDNVVSKYPETTQVNPSVNSPNTIYNVIETTGGNKKSVVDKKKSRIQRKQKKLTNRVPYIKNKQTRKKHNSTK